MIARLREESVIARYRTALDNNPAANMYRIFEMAVANEACPALDIRHCGFAVSSFDGRARLRN